MSTENQTGVVWEEPAPKQRPQRGRYEDELAAIGERPGKWARVTTFSTSASAKRLADQIEDGEHGFVTREGQWESDHGWIDEGPPEGSYATWARKLPATPEPDEDEHEPIEGGPAAL